MTPEERLLAEVLKEDPVIYHENILIDGTQYTQVTLDKEDAALAITQRVEDGDSTVYLTVDQLECILNAAKWNLKHDLKKFCYEDSLTNEMALERAERYGMTPEIQHCLDQGMSPYEALREWDIL